MAKRSEERRLFIDNMEIYNLYLDRLVNIALSQFEYGGTDVPRLETFNRRYFETKLLYEGKAGIVDYKFDDSTEGIMLSLGFDQHGDFDPYGDPIPSRIIFRDFNGKMYQGENEILWDNQNKTPLFPKLVTFAKRLFEVEQTIRMNLKQCINPIAISADGKTQLSAYNLQDSLESYDPYVIMRKGKFGEGEIAPVISNTPTFIGNELFQLKKDIWAEALAVLGIGHQFSKKERLLDGEIQTAREEDKLAVYSRLMNRIDFCDRMNKKFGLDMSVNLSSKAEELADEYTESMFGSEAKEDILGSSEERRDING